MRDHLSFCFLPLILLRYANVALRFSSKRSFSLFHTHKKLNQRGVAGRSTQVSIGDHKISHALTLPSKQSKERQKEKMTTAESSGAGWETLHCDTSASKLACLCNSDVCLNHVLPPCSINTGWSLQGVNLYFSQTYFLLLSGLARGFIK